MQDVVQTTHVLTCPDYNPLSHNRSPRSVPNVSLHLTPASSSPAPTFPAVACCFHLPACWLCVRMAVGMNSDRYRCSLTARDPKPVSHVCVSVAGCRSQWVCLFNQNCTVCLSPVDNNNNNNKVVSAFCPFFHRYPSPHPTL